MDPLLYLQTLKEYEKAMWFAVWLESDPYAEHVLEINNMGVHWLWLKIVRDTCKRIFLD